jgi:hypothetical protein
MRRVASWGHIHQASQVPLPDGVRPAAAADLQLAGLVAGVGGHTLGRCFNVWIPPAISAPKGGKQSGKSASHSATSKQSKNAGYEDSLLARSKIAPGDKATQEKTQVLHRIFSPLFSDQIATAPYVSWPFDAFWRMSMQFECIDNSSSP